jgi:hypothetical protein
MQIGVRKQPPARVLTDSKPYSFSLSSIVRVRGSFQSVTGGTKTEGHGGHQNFQKGLAARDGFGKIGERLPLVSGLWSLGNTHLWVAYTTILSKRLAALRWSG